MKITVKNLGVLKQAEFELGELTIICGLNNTGKTYATYALYGFLDSWQKHLSLNIPKEKIAQLLKIPSRRGEGQGSGSHSSDFLKITGENEMPFKRLSGN